MVVELAFTAIVELLTGLRDGRMTIPERLLVRCVAMAENEFNWPKFITHAGTGLNRILKSKPCGLPALEADVSSEIIGALIFATGIGVFSTAIVGLIAEVSEARPVVVLVLLVFGGSLLITLLVDKAAYENHEARTRLKHFLLLSAFIAAAAISGNLLYEALKENWWLAGASLFGMALLRGNGRGADGSTNPEVTGLLLMLAALATASGWYAPALSALVFGVVLFGVTAVGAIRIIKEATLTKIEWAEVEYEGGDLVIIGLSLPDPAGASVSTDEQREQIANAFVRKLKECPKNFLYDPAAKNADSFLPVVENDRRADRYPWQFHLRTLNDYHWKDGQRPPLHVPARDRI